LVDSLRKMLLMWVDNLRKMSLRNHYYNLPQMLPYIAWPDLASQVLEIGDKLYPVSPMRIVVLLEKTPSDQGYDALVVTREEYYRAVAEQSENIRKKYEREIDSYLGKYLKYARIRIALGGLRAFTALSEIVALLVMCAAAILLLALYVPNSSLHLRDYYFRHLGDFYFRDISLHVNLVSKRDSFIIIVAAYGAVLVAWLFGKLILQQIYRTYKSLQPSAQVLDQPLTNEFRNILIGLMRKSQQLRYEPMLRSDRAPTLVEVESVRVFPSATFDEVADFLRQHVTSAVGIAGSRGAGKSTLLRWLFNTLAPEWITVYLATPAIYNALDFARMIFGSTVNTILTSYQSGAIPVQSRRWHAIVRAFRRRPRPTEEELADVSYEILNVIGRSRTDQWSTAGGFSSKGVSLTRQKQTTVTEREPTHPELIAAFMRYLETYRRLGGRKIVIVIDELDKLASAEDAIGAVNSLKDLFHLPNTHFVVSVSEDAMARFAMRGIPLRDVFDSAFDDIVKVQPPSPEDAWKLLAYRTGGFPISAALFCYAWSGGLPRDLIRTARACVDIRRRSGQPVAVAELTPTVVRNDLKDALDAALTNVLQEDGTQGVESMLALRRKLEDESVPLVDVLKSADLRVDLEARGGDENRLLLLQRLALYVDLGSSVIEYFTSSFDEEVKANFDEVQGIVRKFARAKLALSSYPSEAEWLLSEALKGATGKSGNRLAHAGNAELGTRVNPTVLAVPYIRRDMEEVICAHLRREQPVLLVGSSMVGKTRMAAQIIQREFGNRPVAIPDTKAALADLDARDITLRDTVIWLDDIDRLIGSGGISDRALRRLADAGNIIVATIRAKAYDQFRPSDQLRPPEWDVLNVFEKITISRELTGSEQQRLADAVHDQSIRERIRSAGLGEYVGGCWQIAEALQLGQAGTDPIGYAVVQGAADWRRCGMIRPVPAQVLPLLAGPHLDQRCQARLADPDAYSQGLTWATRNINPNVSLLQPAGTGYSVFDYALDLIIQQATLIPASNWDTIIAQADPTELVELGYTAEITHHRTSTAIEAFRKAASSGHADAAPIAAANLEVLLAERGGVEDAKADRYTPNLTPKEPHAPEN
jgi:hypothetical protein